MTNEEKLQERLNKAIEVFKQKEAEIAELHTTIENKDKAYKILQDTYNEVFAELNKLKEQHEILNKKYAKRKEQIVELESQLSWAEEDNENLQNINEIISQPKKEKVEIPVKQQNIFTPVNGAFTI